MVQATRAEALHRYAPPGGIVPRFDSGHVALEAFEEALHRADAVIEPSGKASDAARANRSGMSSFTSSCDSNARAIAHASELAFVPVTSSNKSVR